MDFGSRLNKGVRNIFNYIGQPSSTKGERYRILESSKPTTVAKSTIDEQSSSSRQKSTSEQTFPDPNERYYAYCNTNFDSNESISAACGSANNGFTSSLNGHSVLGDMKNSSICDQNKFLGEREINFRRSPLDLHEENRRYGFMPEENSFLKLKRDFLTCCSCHISCFISVITSLFPILTWLPKYRMAYLLPDIISGFTISILHIPQGMAYGMLASLKAENGLYVSFFPVLIYFVFGTSRHISIGTFAVISLMVSSAIHKGTIVPAPMNGTSSTNTTLTGDSVLPSSAHLEVAATLCILVGFWQLLMGVFRLGSLSVVLSDQLISGFTTGAAVHVATSQLADLFGLSLPRHSENFKIVYIYMDIFKHLKFTNIATLIISAVAIFALAFVKEQVNERYKDKLKIAIPIDLGVVVVATTISYFVDFKNLYQVSVMEDIPTGLPEPSIPTFGLFKELLTESFAIAIVVFAISLSMAKLFSRKHRYNINANQELIALGCANVFASFFSCYPCSASLSRSLVQERSGGITQIASVVSCCILLLVLLVLAPLFYTLPKCILSAVILVALKGMFLQVQDVFKAWKISKNDAFIWLVTFLCTILLDVSYGLLCGVVFSIFTVIIRTAVPSKTLLGNIIGTDLYLDVQRFSEAKELSGVKIFHFQSALYFMNKEYFKNSLLKYVPIIERERTEENCEKDLSDSIHHIIVDCSSFSYVDVSGLDTLLEVMNEYEEIGIIVYLSGCSVSMCDMMERANFFPRMPKQSDVFPTIHDAVQFVQ